MTDLVTQNSSKALAAFNGGSNPFAKAAEEMGATEGLFMKFNGNTGAYTVGADQDELPDGSEVVAVMDSIARGWICWKEEEVVDEVMVPILEGDSPRESELEDHGPYEGDGGWNQQVRIVLKNPETGDTYTLKTSSRAATRALATLMKEYGRHYKNRSDEYPIISLSSSSYVPKEKKFGKKYAPVFKIVDWMNIEEANALTPTASSDNEDNYEAEEQQAVEKKQEEQAPRQRRTRNF